MAWCVMHRFCLVLAAGAALAGCSLFAADDVLDYAFSPSRSVYALGDTLAANFVNRSAQTVYFWGCPPARLLHMSDGGWQEVRLDFPCYRIFGRLAPVELDPGEQHSVRIDGRVIEEADVSPGPYRLVLHIGTRNQEQTRIAVSEPFAIEP